MISQLVNDEPIVTPEGGPKTFLPEIMDVTFKMVNSADYYVLDLWGVDGQKW